ncbi:hypothetical protein FZC73_22685 [Enterobacter hormaechei]|nr:hypothetical protein FZC73_22685 [Enterobacter hormaechei]
MGSCAAPSAKGDDKFITTDYLQQCPRIYPRMVLHGAAAVLRTPKLKESKFPGSMLVFMC